VPVLDRVHQKDGAVLMGGATTPPPMGGKWAIGGSEKMDGMASLFTIEKRLTNI